MLGDAALQKKRQFAEERAERLKDPRMRVLGIDKNALDEQAKEKKAMQDLEKERNAFFDNQALLMDKHATVLQREVDNIRQQRDLEVLNFRATFQKKESSREWDLNDPKRVVGTLPARIADDDPRLGASSLQKFEGEDLDYTNRKKAQAEQLKQWTQQQMDEKLMAKWIDADANRLYQDRAEEVAYRTWAIQNEIANQRRQMAVTTAEFNKAVAEQKRKERLQDRFSQTQKNMEEIENNLNSDMLNEKEGRLNEFGLKKPKSDFKGLGDSKRQEILQIQEAQRQSNARRRQQEAENEQQMALQEQMDNRMALALERQRERERREAAIQLGEERKVQKEESQKKASQLKDLYANAVGEEYFVFGKCL